MKDTCPRRMNEFGPWKRDAALDKFKKGKCPFCGSLDPDLVLDAVEAGRWMLGPTDKSYKAYVQQEVDEARRDVGKLYFQHFTEDQQERFIKLLNETKITIGYPGHFYVLPFFCRSAAASPAATR